jgi:hypothetical protein
VGSRQSKRFVNLRDEGDGYETPTSECGTSTGCRKKRRNAARPVKPKSARRRTIVNKGVNRDNTLGYWVTGMTAMATETAKRRETLAGWSDDKI